MDDPYEQGILDDVTEHGWSGLIIEPEDDAPGFEYSIGFETSQDHPEVILFGLPDDVMHEILWNVYHDVVDGRRFEVEGLYEELVEGVPCYFKPVHVSQHPDYLGYGMWHRHHLGKADTLRAVQCFWPDGDGRFPWEDGCEPAVIDAQPDLSLPGGADPSNDHDDDS